MLILGRALGNGYAISAVIGNEKIMNRSNDTYISSIFWSENWFSGSTKNTRNHGA